MEDCYRRFNNSISLSTHQKQHEYTSTVFHVAHQAFNYTSLVLRKQFHEDEGIQGFDFITSPSGIKEVQKIINSQVVEKHALTLSIAVTINFMKYDIDGGISKRVSPCFSSRPYYINNVSSYNTKQILLSSALEITKRFDDFIDKGSGWTLESFKWFDLHITQVNDLRGGCSDKVIDPIKDISSRKAGLLNISNDDNMCLLYCIAASFTNKSNWSYMEKSNPDSYRDSIEAIKTKGRKKSVNFPITLSEITTLEQLNREEGLNSILFRINVFREDPVSAKVQLIRSSPLKDGKIINVLLVEFEHNDMEHSHYILIEKASFFKKRYISPVTAKYSYASTIFCDVCLEHFRSGQLLDLHKEVCGKANKCIKVFPKKGETLHFENHEFAFKRIFTGYADFESILEDTSNPLKCPECCSTVETEYYECAHSFTIPTNIHQPCSVSFVIIDRYGKLVHSFKYTGEDVILHFIKDVLNCEDVLVNTTKFNRYMIFGRKEKDEFDKADICYICKNNKGIKGKAEKPFSPEDPKVRDHDHLTGKFLGASHMTCNLNKRREKPFLSIFFHNFSGTDCILDTHALMWYNNNIHSKILF